MKYILRVRAITLGSVGSALCLASILWYGFRGFAPLVTVLLLLGCACLAAAAFRLSPAAPKVSGSESDSVWKAPGIGKRDFVIAGIMLLFLAPLYLINVHDFPRQMNTDEISIMSTERTLSSSPNVDIFAPSYYSDLPGFIFWFLGKIGVALGGVTLGHMRLVHAGSGILIIILSFFLLRLLALPRFAAVAGMAAIALCHSMFFISRLAMRDNTATLFEVITLLLLMYGWKQKNYGWTLLGGFMGGLTFYTYYPSRITLAIWLSFMVLLLVRNRFRGWRTSAKFVGTMLLGTIVIAAPLFIATARHTPTDPYASHQFLWQTYAQQQEKDYRGTATVAEAVKINIEHGLTAFNKPWTDQGMMYYHPGFGFLDMFTGIILWIGVAALLVGGVVARRITENELLALTGFLVIYLSLSFLLTRAPDYTRLLTVMPFLGYMVGRAAMGISEIGLPTRKLHRLHAAFPWIVTAVLILIIGAANLFIALDFYHQGNASGDGTGDTLRFMEKHDTENAQWTFVPGISTQYYSWGIPSYWQFWLEFGKGSSQPLQMASTADIQNNALTSLPAGAHGYLLTTGEVWQAYQSDFASHWKIDNIQWLDPAHNRVAVTYSD